MDSTKSNEGRADARQVTPAEGKAFATLLEEIGFAPNVMFGREASHLPLWFQRLIEGKVYAIVPTVHRGPNNSNGVLKYTLLTAPATAQSTNGTAPVKVALRRSKGSRAAWTPERKEAARKQMKALWAARHATGKAPKQTLE